MTGLSRWPARSRLNSSGVPPLEQLNARLVSAHDLEDFVWSVSSCSASELGDRCSASLLPWLLCVWYGHRSMHQSVRGRQQRKPSYAYGAIYIERMLGVWYFLSTLPATPDTRAAFTALRGRLTMSSDAVLNIVPLYQVA